MYKRFAAYISGEADSIQTYVLKLFTDLSSILNAYNGNIIGIELMEMSTNCTKLVIVLLSLLNNLIYEQASRKKLFSIFVSNLMGPLMQLQSHHSSPLAASQFKISQSRKITFLMKKIFGNAVFSHAEIQSYPSAFGTIKDFKDKNINPEKKEKMSKTKKKSCLHQYHMWFSLYKKSTKLVSIGI